MSASVISTGSSASAMDTALSAVEEMTFTEKLSFMAKLAALIAKETKGDGAVAKAARKERKGKNPRKLSINTKAWQAFIEHCITTMPEKFPKNEKGKLIMLRKSALGLVSEIKTADPSAYDAFVADFVAKHPASASASASDAESDAESAASPVAATVVAPKEEKPAAKVKAPKEPKAPKPEKVKAPKEPKPEKVKEDKPKGKKKTAESASAAPPAPEYETSIVIKEINGVKYHMDTTTMQLYKYEKDGGFGEYAGTYNP